MRFHPAAVLAISLAAVPFAGCASPSALHAAAPAAMEGGGGSFGRDGLYVGAYGLKSFEQFDVSGTGVDTGDSDLGLGLKAGLRFGNRFAVEGFVESVDGFEIDAGVVEADLELLQVGVMGKMFFMTGSRVQPWIAAGGGGAEADVSDFDIDHGGGFLRAAAGVDVWLTENVAAFGELNYNRLTGGVEDLDHVDLQLGVIFHF